MMSAILPLLLELNSNSLTWDVEVSSRELPSIRDVRGMREVTEIPERLSQGDWCVKQKDVGQEPNNATSPLTRVVADCLG
jgi:hypothetical protein